MLLRLGAPRYAQPLGLEEIDWSNPLARGLTHFRVGSDTRNKVKRNALVFSGSTPALIAEGAARRYVRTTGRFDEYAAVNLNGRANGQPASLAVVYRMFSTPATTRIISLGLQAGNRGFGITPSGPTPRALAINAGGGNIVLAGATGSIVPGMWHSNVATVGTSLRFYTDSGSFGPTTVGGGVRWDVGGGLRFGSDEVESNPLDGEIALGAAWDRELTAKEAAAFNANPWQLLRPRRIWVPTSAAAGEFASVADSGSAAELLSIFVGATLSEQASADMAFGGAAAASIADAAAGADAASLVVHLTALDGATGFETVIASCAAGLADAAQGVDAIALFAATLVQLLDAAAGADAVMAGVQAAVADTAVAIDQPSVAALAALLDAGLSTDQLQLQVHVALSDLGGGGDAVAVLQETLRTVADAVVGTDGISAAVELQLTDTGAAAELLALAAQLQLLEQTFGLDIAVQLSPTTPRKVRLVFRQAHRRMLFSLRQRQAVFRPS